jgi:hypothetical protein
VEKLKDGSRCSALRDTAPSLSNRLESAITNRFAARTQDSPDSSDPASADNCRSNASSRDLTSPSPSAENSCAVFTCAERNRMGMASGSFGTQSNELTMRPGAMGSELNESRREYC